MQELCGSFLRMRGFFLGFRGIFNIFLENLRLVISGFLKILIIFEDNFREIEAF
jgi:hypothetical protein